MGWFFRKNLLVSNKIPTGLLSAFLRTGHLTLRCQIRKEILQRHIISALIRNINEICCYPKLWIYPTTERFVLRTKIYQLMIVSNAKTGTNIHDESSAVSFHAHPKFVYLSQNRLVEPLIRNNQSSGHEGRETGFFCPGDGCNKLKRLGRYPQILNPILLPRG